MQNNGSCLFLQNICAANVLANHQCYIQQTWCKEAITSLRSFNSESSPLFTCKISRLGNYQNLSGRQFLKASQTGKLLLWIHHLSRYCALTMLIKGFCAMTVTLIYKTMRLRRIFSLRFIRALIIIAVRRTLIQTYLVRQTFLRYRFKVIYCEFK